MCEYHRKTFASIALRNISHNFEVLSSRMNNSKLIPVVKADAYGHGADAIVRHLYYNHGVRLFAVSLLEEAKALYSLGLDIDILIMGPLDEDDLPVVSKYGFVLTVTSDRMWNSVQAFSGSLRFHVKVDTGMHRLGLKSEHAIKEIFKVSLEKSTLHLEGLYTHFATADSDEAYFLKQKETFRNIVSHLPWKPPIIHASNSSAIIKYENDLESTTHSRVGIALYGYTLERHVDFLKPAMTLHTQVAEINALKRGDKLGYNITYEASENELIAILPIGYGDGWIRKNQGGSVVIRDKLYPIVGRVCMDMTFVRIDASVSQGDEVILFGDTTVTADTVAKRTNTISYEVLCLIGKRVPRVYNN